MGKTWSRGTNSRLLFGVNVNLNLSFFIKCTAPPCENNGKYRTIFSTFPGIFLWNA